MTTTRSTMVDGGRVVILADLRRALGLVPGDAIVFELKDDELRMRPACSVLHRIQNKLKDAAGTAPRLSDELVAERRAEARRLGALNAYFDSSPVLNGSKP